jgi:hypothetical protein
MSLLQLLSVGRAFGSIRDRPSPYKMTQASLLPKFGPPVGSGSEPAAPAVPGRASLERHAGAHARSTGEPGKKEVKMTAAEMSVAPLGTEMNPAQPYPAGRWTMRNPFNRKPVAGARGTPMVQGELSLDAVRPVRNDLSDSDLVVVRASHPAARPAPAPPAAACVTADPPVGVEADGDAPGTSPLWSRLRARLLKRV